MTKEESSFKFPANKLVLFSKSSPLYPISLKYLFNILFWDSTLEFLVDLVISFSALKISVAVFVSIFSILFSFLTMLLIVFNSERLWVLSIASSMLLLVRVLKGLLLSNSMLLSGKKSKPSDAVWIFDFNSALSFSISDSGLLVIFITWFFCIYLSNLGKSNLIWEPAKAPTLRPIAAPEISPSPSKAEAPKPAPANVVKNFASTVFGLNIY